MRDDMLSLFLNLTVSNSSKTLNPDCWNLGCKSQILSSPFRWNPLKSHFGLVKSKHFWANPGATDSCSTFWGSGDGSRKISPTLNRGISVLWWENHRKIMEKKTKHYGENGLKNGFSPFESLSQGISCFDWLIWFFTLESMHFIV